MAAEDLWYKIGFNVGWFVVDRIWKAKHKANTVESTITQEHFDQNIAFYREQIGLGKDFKFDKQSFDNFVAARKKSIDELATTFETAAKDEKLKAALAKPEVKKLVQDALSKQGRAQGPVLEDENMPEDNLDVAQKAYNDLTQHFHELAQKIPPLKVEAVIQTMKETIDTGVHSVQRQQQLEKENLNKLFDPGSSFVTKLTEEGISDTAAVKKAMTADLRKTHNEQMKAFKASTSESLKQVHDAAKTDYLVMNLLSLTSAASEEMKKQIRIKTNEKQKKEIAALDEKINTKNEEIKKLGATPEDQQRKTKLENEIEKIQKQRELVAIRFVQKDITALDKKITAKEAEIIKLGTPPADSQQKTVLEKEIEEMKKQREQLLDPSGQRERTALDKKITAKEEEIANLGTSRADQQRKRDLEKEIAEIKEQRALIATRFGQLVAQLNADTKRDPHVGHIHLSDLPEIHSKTGAIIKQDLQKPGEFTLEIGAMLSLSGPKGYFFGNKIQHDLDLMAEAVKASGKTDIQMTINYSNEVVARQRAEQAYRACVNAGYPPDKIKIVVKVNGQELGVTKNDKKEDVKNDKYWTPESVFTQKQLAEFKDKAAAKTKKEEESLAFKTEGHDTQPVKEALAALKAEHEEAEQEEQLRKAAASINAEDELDEESTAAPLKTN